VGATLFLFLAWPEVRVQRSRALSTGAWLALAYGGVLGAGIGYIVFWRSIGEIGVTRTMVCNMLIPPVAIVIAIVALGESFIPIQVLDAIATLVGTVLPRLVPVRGSRVWHEHCTMG
jgi:drug/metabolite transporter (DMT)-like permease